MRAVIVTSHPIQYQAPLFRELSKRVDLTAVFLMQQTPEGQSASGFGVEFDWDVPLLEGYRHVFANNIASQPSTNHRDGIILKGHESLLASLEPDVLMTMGWFPRGYLQVIRWAAHQRVPLVCRGESNLFSGSRALPGRLAKFFYFRWLFSKFRAFAVIGRRNRDFYRHYGASESRLHWAPYSVNTDFFESGFHRHRPNQRKPGPWRIGFAGKLIPRKCPLDLVEAVARSRNKDSIELLVIGDGPLRNDLETNSNKAGIRLSVRGFLNQSSIVARGYADLDALVLPSGESETWGLVVNEVMTGGIPVILSDSVGCAPDLVDEGRTGYVFPSGNRDALSAAIDRLVEQLQKGHDFSLAVRERIAGYSLEKTVQGMASALNAAAGTAG
jgi:glycosyltransferase involved in cell wall biosynthesis